MVVYTESLRKSKSPQNREREILLSMDSHGQRLTRVRVLGQIVPAGLVSEVRHSKSGGYEPSESIRVFR